MCLCIGAFFFLFQWATVLESRAASSWFRCTYLRNTQSFNWVDHFHWRRIGNTAIHYTGVWSHLTYDCESATLLGDLLHFSYSSWFLIHLSRVSQSSGNLSYLNKGKFVLDRKDRIQVRGTLMNWGELESRREGALVLGEPTTFFTNFIAKREPKTFFTNSTAYGEPKLLREGVLIVRGD